MQHVLRLLVAFSLWAASTLLADGPASVFGAAVVAAYAFVVLREAFPLSFVGEGRELRLGRVATASVMAVLVGCTIVGGWAAMQVEQRYCWDVARPTDVRSSWRLGHALLVSPVIEEAVFRGIVPQVLIRNSALRWPVWGGSLIAFVILHPPGAIASAMVVGTVCTALAISTRTVWPSVVVHAAMNWATGALELTGFGPPGRLLFFGFGVNCLTSAWIIAAALVAGIGLAILLPRRVASGNSNGDADSPSYPTIQEA
jgi:membrane protease YdiL (CAAX protease family)